MRVLYSAKSETLRTGSQWCFRCSKSMAPGGRFSPSGLASLYSLCSSWYRGVDHPRPRLREVPERKSRAWYEIAMAPPSQGRSFGWWTRASRGAVRIFSWVPLRISGSPTIRLRAVRHLARVEVSIRTPADILRFRDRTADLERGFSWPPHRGWRPNWRSSQQDGVP